MSSEKLLVRVVDPEERVGFRFMMPCPDEVTVGKVWQEIGRRVGGGGNGGTEGEGAAFDRTPFLVELRRGEGKYYLNGDNSKFDDKLARIFLNDEGGIGSIDEVRVEELMELRGMLFELYKKGAREAVRAGERHGGEFKAEKWLRYGSFSWDGIDRKAKLMLKQRLHNTTQRRAKKRGLVLKDWDKWSPEKRDTLALIASQLFIIQEARKIRMGRVEDE